MADLSPDDTALVLRALEHYQAYLIATQRPDQHYKDLIERLQRKAPARETPPATARKKRA